MDWEDPIIGASQLAILVGGGICPAYMETGEICSVLYARDMGIL